VALIINKSPTLIFSGYFAFPITESSLVYHSLCNQFSELGTFGLHTDIFCCNILDSYVMYG
jgi:hypothetical protein